MRPLQKPLNAQSGRHTGLGNYLGTKAECEKRERGFQVYISGANKDRLKLRDLQEEALQAQKTPIDNHTAAVTSTRRIKPPNTFHRRKFWHKNPEIKIKASDGSRFTLQNQKPIKQGIGLHGTVLHDITGKAVEFHPIKRKNSLNLIRNRYKAYFHIDGYGFCCSKETSKSSTPSKYRIDGASPLFNQSSSKILRRIQSRSDSTASNNPQQPYDTVLQQNQYYSVLDRNHERVSKLREFLTPAYEYFQIAKEATTATITTTTDLYNNGSDTLKEATTTTSDSCNGVVYDVFYHNEPNLSRSAQVLFPDEKGSVLYGGRGISEERNCLSYGDGPCASRALPPVEYSHKNGDSYEINRERNEEEEYNVLCHNELGTRALVLLDDQNGLINDGTVKNVYESEGREELPPLEKAKSPTFKHRKSNNLYRNSGKESFMDEGYQLFPNCDTLSKDGMSNCDMDLKSIDMNCKGNTFKLNLRYLQQDLNFKLPDNAALTFDLKARSSDEVTSTSSSNDNELSQTPDHSTTNSSTSCSNVHMLSNTASTGCHERLQEINVSPQVLEEMKSTSVVECGIVDKENENSTRRSHAEITLVNSNQGPRNQERTTEHNTPRLKGKLLSARVQKLDIRKQNYLAHILDKLELAQVTGSVDLFYQFGSGNGYYSPKAPKESLAM